ncbi:cyclic AMP-dependent transcription factor ATF-6 alpha [Ochlerotatus camptorhynchus]|uniref:cyclic AMP-dependent transcription factor ATF-6 alpha n=1 Tax=Ochlerotatus camptorhynchus TaxID=644619 RepID=UPI0031CF2DD4
MDEQQLYDETMLDIDPILEDFPMEMYQGSPGSEGTLDVLESEHNLSPVMESLEELSPNHENGMMSPQYGAFIDPDIFLNGVVKRESESDCSTSSHRNTPSPSDSSKSCDSYPSSGYASCSSAQMNNILFDSPPTSPEYPVNPPQLVSNLNNNIIRVGTAQLPAIQKPSCPTNIADLKKVKIPPKGSINVNGISSGGITKTITKKTIVLTAKDYQALMKNMKNQPNNGTILIKATQASAFVAAASKDKPVLPKPLQQSQVTSSLSTVQELYQPEESVQHTVASVPRPPSAQTHLLLPTIEGSVNERVFKKHQRMIKNRESAYLSRVRKKEYVTSLEQHIDELTKENMYLKDENNGLLEKLKQKCSCHGGNRPSFGHLNAFTKQLTPNVRKNTAIVLAMLFMVSFNFGPLGNLLTGSVRNQAGLETTDDIPHHQRNLLWIEDSNAFNARNVDISLNLTNYEDLSVGAAEEPYAVCPFYVNQTENIRLASELRRWIGENGYKNLTDRDGDDMSINSFSEMFALKDTIDSMYRQMKDISSQMDAFQKRTRLTGNKKRPQLKGKKARELEIYQQQRARKESDLAFYYSGFSKKYAKFFEEIGRRDDTFYLVSFSGEHLLLPALAHNKTNRPKMSLMLPALMDNATHPSDKVTLMQIDCEVMNTSMIQIREKTIPGDLLRSHAKADDSTRANGKKAKSSTDFSDNNVQNVSSSSTAKESRRYNKDPSARPFFVQRMSEHMKHEYDLH